MCIRDRNPDKKILIIHCRNVDEISINEERGGGNFLLLKIIVEGGGENFLYVYYVIGSKAVVLC